MANASYDISNFLGGEISAFAQGRFDKPDYRTSLNVCLNAFPTEMGPWVRRSGSQFGGTTRGGVAGRTIKFDFQQSVPYTLEFTNGKLRFRNGAALANTNDTQVITSISAANPAVVLLPAAATWVTGNTLIFSSPSAPLLENRRFLATKIDTTHFSLTDALTGANIDGSTLGALAAGATVSRVQELDTPYINGAWTDLQIVQAETNAVLLDSITPSQILRVTTPPTFGFSAQFALTALTFIDGPYLDPFVNGVQVSPSAVSGNITITLAFPAYSATQAYATGAFVTSAAVNYISLIDSNVNNTPAISPAAWATTAAGAAINNGLGFLGTDVGRLVRFFSEPLDWAVGTGYTTGQIVSYNPSGQPGGATYWTAIAATTGNIPGTDSTHWALTPANAALWTWGKITGLSNQIAQGIAGATNIGNLTGNGGLAAAFDNVPSKVSTACAALQNAVSAPQTGLIATFWIGRNFSVPGAQKIGSVTLFPSSDLGFFTSSGPINYSLISWQLYAKNTLPGAPSDGTLLGTSGGYSANDPALSAPITIVSSDTTTTWNYIWVVASVIYSTNNQPAFISCLVSQLEYFNPTGTGTSGNGAVIELIGPPLLYTTPIKTWRMGAYSNTTGFPTCGTYNEGRLWLSGAIANRFDASMSNGIVGTTVSFAPTDDHGVVAANNSISETINSDGVNPIFWMMPDLQGIILGTQAGEYLVQAPTTGPMSPFNIAARRVTKIGCANVEPRRTEHTTIFAQRFGRKLMEYFPDVYSGKFTAPNIADKAEHIVRAGIAELAYASAVTPIVWGRDALGALFGMSYKRDTLTTSQGPTFNGWHRHTLGSGRTVESICVGPSIGGDLDSLTMVTNDAVSGIRHVEILTDTMDETSALGDAWFLDDAVTPSSTSTTNASSAGAPYGGLTLNGLWHLNGKTVQVFAGGLDCGDRGLGPTSFTDFVVSNGSCFVPYGDGISAGSGRGLFTADFAAVAGLQIVVGFTYNSDGQMVRPISVADSGSRIGPSLGELRRNHRYSMLLSNTLGISVGATFTAMIPANFKQANSSAIAQLTTFSGVHQDSLKDDYSYDGMICWRVSRPWPANVVAMAGNIATQDQ